MTTARVRLGVYADCYGHRSTKASLFKDSPSPGVSSTFYTTSVSICVQLLITSFASTTRPLIFAYGNFLGNSSSESDRAMPSFLSKVFGRKKDEKETLASQGRASDPSLLEGKFEHVSPNVSPTIAICPEGAGANGNGNGSAKEKDKDKDVGFALFKSKSRTLSSAPSIAAPSSSKSSLPLLSLDLPAPKEAAGSRTLDVVFESDPDAHILLSDDVIGQRRLKPSEVQLLVQICSQAIMARGRLLRAFVHSESLELIQ